MNYTVGFVENTDENGIKINDILVPATLRINDDGFALSEKQCEADLIFVRANSDKTYKELCFKNNEYCTVPDEVVPLIDKELILLLSK